MGSLTFYVVYFGLLLADLTLFISQPSLFLRPFIEPLMIVLLLLHFRQEYRKDHTCDPRLIHIALGAILLGGVFLMYESPVYKFLIGFCFFLVTNIAYTILFYRCADLHVKRAIPFIIVAAVVAMVLLYIFYEHVGDYFILASAYVFVLLNCVQAAYLRYTLVNAQSYYLVFTGVILFFISQVAAAVFHFMNRADWLGVLIIATFFISQFLIIKGVLKNKTELTVPIKDPVLSESADE